MANNLIHGTQAGSNPPAADPATGLVPTWGYRADGSSQIFNLKPGEALPEGWHDSPSLAALDAATKPEESPADTPPVEPENKPE